MFLARIADTRDALQRREGTRLEDVES